MDIVERIVEEMKEVWLKTKREYISISPEECENLTQFDSKFGGIPYMPDGFEYPYSRSDPDQPLKLLAQINFDDVPTLRDFPERGILQIYINPANQLWYGCDSVMRSERGYLRRKINMYGYGGKVGKYEAERYSILKDMKLDSEYQNEYRVIFHENVNYYADNTDKVPASVRENDKYFVVEKPMKLLFGTDEEYVPYDEEGLSERFLELYTKYTGEEPDEIDDIEDARWSLEQAFDSTRNGWTKIGGYRIDPGTQEAQWSEDDDDILLLQISSRKGMRFGDDGIAHFAMSREELRNRDFSGVFYDWVGY